MQLHLLHCVLGAPHKWMLTLCSCFEKGVSETGDSVAALRKVASLAEQSLPQSICHGSISCWPVFQGILLDAAACCQTMSARSNLHHTNS